MPKINKYLVNEKIMFPEKIIQQATEIIAVCSAQKHRFATAESCTGGLIAALLTEIAGASAVFERGFVTYSNEAKQEMLGVVPELIAEHGAVSSEVANAMAEGALRHSHADSAISVTGIAGPGGGSLHKPVGLVYIGYALGNGKARAQECNFSGDRGEIRMQSVAKALEILKGHLCCGN